MDAQTRTAIIKTTTTLNQLVDNLESLFTQLVEKPASQFVGVEPVGDGLFLAYYSDDYTGCELSDISQVVCICDDEIEAANAVDTVSYILNGTEPNLATLFKLSDGKHVEKWELINPWFEKPAGMKIPELYSCVLDIITTGEDPMKILDGDYGLSKFLEIYGTEDEIIEVDEVDEKFEELLDDIAEAAEEETLADELDALIESIQNPVSFEDILAEAISILVSNAK